MLGLLFADQTTSLLDYLSRAGVVTFLIIVVYGGYKRWWVFGWAYKESQDRYDKLITDFERMRDEKDAWRDTALKGTDIAAQIFERSRPLYPER